MTRIEELLHEYDQDHQHPHNRALHMVGITLIGASALVVWVAPPLAVGLFAAGWAAQLLGHAIEGKPPSFRRDPAFMAIGALWYRDRVLSTLRRTSAQGV